MTKTNEPAGAKPDVFFFRYRPAFFGGFVEPPQPVTGDGTTQPLPELRPSIQIWTTHPASVNYDPDEGFPIDLTRTPASNCPADDVKLDDHVNLQDGFTTLGPSHPHAYGAGSVYIRIPDDVDDSPAFPQLPGEMIPTDQTAIVVKQSSGDLQRYHGFTGLRLIPRNYQSTSGVQNTQSLAALNLWVVYHPGSASGAHSRPPRKLVIPRVSQLQDPFRVLSDSGITQGVIDRLTANQSDYASAGKQQGSHGDDQSQDELAIYLQRDYALYTAALDVPKKPSGCSEVEADSVTSAGLQAAGADLKNASAAARRGQRYVQRLIRKPHGHGDRMGWAGHPPGGSGRPSSLNVIGAFTDCQTQPRDKLAEVPMGELDVIARNIARGGYDNLLQLREEETLLDAVSRFADKYPGRKFDCLDLIGHSRGRDNILKLGEFALTSREASKQFSALANGGILASLGIKTVRLLGCRTACSPRARRVVEAILKFFRGSDQYAYPVSNDDSHSAYFLYPVYATRGDLFAVHFDSYGFRMEATPLLADSDVISNAGPGDLPPGDDYPPDPPSDDDDAGDADADADGDGGHAQAPIVIPSSFSDLALSDCNAALVAAKSFLYWPDFPTRFKELQELLCWDLPIQDNPLVRATCEVLVSISNNPRSIDDLRSFDLMLDGTPDAPGAPRVRIHTSYGLAYGFAFIPQAKDASKSLATIKDKLAKLQLVPLSDKQARTNVGVGLSARLASWI